MSDEDVLSEVERYQQEIERYQQIAQAHISANQEIAEEFRRWSDLLFGMLNEPGRETFDVGEIATLAANIPPRYRRPKEE